MSDYLEKFSVMINDKLLKSVESPDLFFNYLSKTVIVGIILLLISNLILRIVDKTSKNIIEKKHVKRKIILTTQILISICTLIIWLDSLNTLIILLLAIALFVVVVIRGTLDNIIAWFFISKGNYFKLNDRIEINGYIGKVVSINSFHFELVEMKHWLSTENLTGRTVKIPNKEIFDKEVFNYSTLGEMVWQEIDYTLSHDSDFNKAESIILKEVNTYYDEILLPILEKEKFDELGMDIQPKSTLQVTKLGLVVTCRFIVDYHQVSTIKTRLHKKIVKKFNEDEDIEFAALDIKLNNGIAINE